MSDQYGWEPCSKDIGEALLGDFSALRYDAIAKLSRRTGLRAQIAVLEEMPVPTVQVGNKVHLCSDNMRWVMRKIAALRKELER